MMISDQNVLSLTKKKKGFFPFKLYELLEAETAGYESVVSWSPDGQSFVVHDIDAFTKDVLPRYFKSKKFRSFVSIMSV